MKKQRYNVLLAFVSTNISCYEILKHPEKFFKRELFEMITSTAEPIK